LLIRAKSIFCTDEHPDPGWQWDVRPIFQRRHPNRIEESRLKERKAPPERANSLDNRTYQASFFEV
jgi:hypothetical protein